MLLGVLELSFQADEILLEERLGVLVVLLEKMQELLLQQDKDL